jgi:hypothetical protein
LVLLPNDRAGDYARAPWGLSWFGTVSSREARW